jgi:SNF2 family DNA or RNA helicase
MLNARKLKKDFAPAVLKEGKTLFDEKMVKTARIVKIDPQTVRLSCLVEGGFNKKYTCEIEIDRIESETLDTDCDCSHSFDCSHLASVLFHLEENFDEMLVNYSKETDVGSSKFDEKSKVTLLESIKVAENKEKEKKDKRSEKELLEEYIGASSLLGLSSFFLPQEKIVEETAEILLIFTPLEKGKEVLDVQMALRLPYRSKPLNILNVKEFLSAVRFKESLYLGNRKTHLSLESFSERDRALLRILMDRAFFPDKGVEEKMQRIGKIDFETFGMVLAEAYGAALKKLSSHRFGQDRELEPEVLPGFYLRSLDEPLQLSLHPASLLVDLEYLEAPQPKILLNPSIRLHQEVVTLEQVILLESAKPGLLFENIYYPFKEMLQRRHLRNLAELRFVTIPEPLFGTFVENSIGELKRFAEVRNADVLDKFVTLPFVGELMAECHISYLNGELDATLHFVYDDIKIPASKNHLKSSHLEAFVRGPGILARNLTEEQKIIDDLFQDFVFDPVNGLFIAKNEKKIVEFMTEVVPKNQGRVIFHCPENLMEQFIYDDTTFTLELKESGRIDAYSVDLKVDGNLKGISLDVLWECLSSKRTFIELLKKTETKNKAGAFQSSSKLHKILVLDLEKLLPVVQIFDELGIEVLNTHKEERPLWSLAGITEAQFEGLPIKFSMSEKLKEIQRQMLGEHSFEPSIVPQVINAKLRDYQFEGVGWLERLRGMHLNGILADDMGLGKTLQAITAITQQKEKNPKAISIIVCPTSLVYNWHEEFLKFNKTLKVLPIDGTPVQRKKMISTAKKYDVLITSYSLLQKDIEDYQAIEFSYAILDEAHHIKNRTTRNAKSVKMIRALHRLVLTGTPIENSLDELWSLFDFLMPGLLSSYDRFIEKYIRNPEKGGKTLENLRNKVSPFILRRMKKDVLKDLPPVTEIVYHCHLSDSQKALYRSYAESARAELAELVKKEGFNKVQIHVLATLTRLKQICCHPAIFAKERPEVGDSAKYDMLMELLSSLVEGKHKTVIFSQYTRMLQIMSEDLTAQGIVHEYLDGSTKDRLGVVKRFNDDPNVSVFLVSLKAGGTGLNLTSADTVIHYDMWWNPAVEAQATDRVHRIGQKNNVSSYKLVTLNTIEEKIVELQNRKKGLVTKVVSCDEEAISKLTWEEVLALLQT